MCILFRTINIRKCGSLTFHFFVCVTLKKIYIYDVGGLRLVTPPNSDKYAQESSRQFDEAYGESLGLFDMHARKRREGEGGERMLSNSSIFIFTFI